MIHQEEQRRGSHFLKRLFSFLLKKANTPKISRPQPMRQRITELYAMTHLTH